MNITQGGCVGIAEKRDCVTNQQSLKAFWAWFYVLLGFPRSIKAHQKTIELSSAIDRS